jgi:hypothetical protein
MEDQHSLPRLLLAVTPESLSLFTTVLQSGIEIKSRDGVTMGHFLNDLPGFTADYIGDTVQTIFLNGTAIDDLTTPLTGNNPVLALSAAMPGLAGAIFRKNSYHSALRTDTQKVSAAGDEQKSLTVTLKLFNNIAKDCGVELLKSGVYIQSISLTNFLIRRSALLLQIQEISFKNEHIDKDNLLQILSDAPKLKLKLVETHG